MSEAQRPPLGDDRPTGPDPDAMATTGRPAIRTVLAKGERVPWPRRLIATGLLAGVLALALHALPRPYQSIPTGVVRGLGDAYGSLRYTYRNDVAALEPVAGEASAAERQAYARELWRYRWFGSFREILLRFSEWLAASCMVVALSMIAVERRRLRRDLRARGATTEAVLVRRESIAGASAGGAPQPPPPTEPPLSGVPLRETGDEVTPPHPTPVPSKIPSGLELRPAQFDDDDDLGRTTEGRTPNLARTAAAVKAPASTRAPTSTALPVFFAERRHPEPHPVVHPGDAPPAEPMPTPVPGPDPLPSAARAETTAESPVQPPRAATASDDDLPVWLKTPRR